MSYSYTYGAELDLANGYTFRDGQLYNQFGENERAQQGYSQMQEIVEEVSNAFGPEFGMRGSINYAQTYAQQLQSNFIDNLNQVSSRLGGFINLESSDIGPGDPFYVAPLMPTLIFTPDGSNVEVTTYNGSSDIEAPGASENVVQEVVVTGAVATVLEVNLLDIDQIEQTLINPNGPNSLAFSPYGLNSGPGEPYAPFKGKPLMAPGSTRHFSSAEIAAIQVQFFNQTGFTVTQAQLEAININSGGSMPLSLNLANFFTNQSIFTSYAAATTWNATTIDVSPEYALTDFSTNPGTMDLIIHEIEHVNQFINNPVAALTFLNDEQQGLSTDVYAISPATLQTPFAGLNYETQAAIEQNMYRAENGLDLVDGSGFVTSSGLPMSKSALAAELLAYTNGQTF